MEHLLFNIAYAGLSVCTLLYLLYLFSKREKYSHAAHAILLTALFLHLSSLVLRILATHAVPWTDWFESLSFFSATVTLIYLLIAHKNHIPILGAFIMPISWGLLTAAVFADKSVHPLPAALQNSWLAVHIPVLFASYAILAIAFAVGIVYLLQEYQMKSRHPSELTYRLPSLEVLDTLIFRLILAAFPFLSLGIFLGGLWAYQVWGRYWGWDPKETWALMTWLIYGLYLYVRFFNGWRGRKTAYLSLAGFGFVLFTYVGVNYFSPLHGFLKGVIR